MDDIGCASNGARSHTHCGNQESRAPWPFARRWPSGRLDTRVIFHPYRLSGACGTLAAENGVLEASDGRSRRLPAPVRGDDATISGDGWSFKATAGWVVREGARRGDYEVVPQQP